MSVLGQRSTRPQCRAPGCTSAAVARGLCRPHYKRERAGKPLLPVRLVGPQKGDRDGYGRYGMLDDDGDTVLCHECGRRAVLLGKHAQVTHGMTSREYKLAHGLPLSRGMLPSGVRAAKAARSIAQVGTAAWGRLEASRDPAAAAQARTAESFIATGRQSDPEVARAAGRTQRKRRFCTFCGKEWEHAGVNQKARTCSRECRNKQISAALRDPERAARDAKIVSLHIVQKLPADVIAGEVGLTRKRVLAIIRRDTRPRADGTGSSVTSSP